MQKPGMSCPLPVLFQDADPLLMLRALGTSEGLVETSRRLSAARRVPAAPRGVPGGPREGVSGLLGREWARSALCPSLC